MPPPVHNPPTPTVQPIPAGCHPGTIVHVTGTFTPGAASLIIKLQSGPNGDPADEVGLCIYGRVQEHQLGRNSFTRATGWGNEELTPNVHGLAPSANFDIAILCDPACFKIAMNGQHLCEFQHRMNPNMLNHVQIGSLSGDLTLSCLWVEESNTAPPPPASAPQMPYNPNPVGGYAPPPAMGGIPSYPGGAPPQNMYPGAPQGPYPSNPGGTYPGGPQYPPGGQYGGHGSGGGKGLEGMLGGVIGGGAAGAIMKQANKIIGGGGGHHKGGNYPGGGAQYPGGGAQYPGGGAQYPGGGAQYPGGGANYPGGPF